MTADTIFDGAFSERSLSKMKVELDWKLNRKCFNFADWPILSQFQFSLWLAVITGSPGCCDRMFTVEAFISQNITICIISPTNI